MHFASGADAGSKEHAAHLAVAAQVCIGRQQRAEERSVDVDRGCVGKVEQDVARVGIGGCLALEVDAALQGVVYASNVDDHRGAGRNFDIQILVAVLELILREVEHVGRGAGSIHHQPRGVVVLCIRVVDRVGWASALGHNRSVIVDGADHSVHRKAGKLSTQGVHLCGKRGEVNGGSSAGHQRRSRVEATGVVLVRKVEAGAGWRGRIDAAARVHVEGVAGWNSTCGHNRERSAILRGEREIWIGSAQIGADGCSLSHLARGCNSAGNVGLIADVTRQGHQVISAGNTKRAVAVLTQLSRDSDGAGRSGCTAGIRHQHAEGSACCWCAGNCARQRIQR